MHLLIEIFQQELDTHIKKLEEKFGAFIPAGPNIQLDPKTYENQLENMIPAAFAQHSTSTHSWSLQHQSTEDQQDDEAHESLEIVEEFPNMPLLKWFIESLRFGALKAFSCQNIVSKFIVTSVRVCVQFNGKEYKIQNKILIFFIN